MQTNPLKKTLLAAVLGLTAWSAAACSSHSNDGGGDASASGVPSAGGTKAAATGTGPSADPAAKYESPITVTAVMGLSDQVQKSVSIKPDVITDNIWTRGYEKDLGIKIHYLWTVPSAQMEQKMNVSISSNDLPDIIPVNSRQLKMLVDTGVAMDITQLFDQYASDFTKQMMDADQRIGMDQATVNGKLMALPAINGAIDGASMIWIRADWLKNLNMEPPRTMDDVLKIAEAFTKNDPDQNGKDDTYGLGLNKDLLGGFAVLDGFFEGYHGYANGWIDDGSGNLAYGGIQPAIKTALGKLADMYKNGYIDKEFSVKDTAKVAESVTSGKVGMFFGQHYVPFWPLQDAKNKDANADWQAFPIVSADDQPAKPMINGSSGTFYVVNKKMKNPEAAIKLYNYFYAKDPALSPDFDPAYHGQDSELDTHPDQFYQLAVMTSFYPQQNLFIHQNVDKYFKDNDSSVLDNYWVKDNVGNIEKYKAGDDKLWSSYAWAGPDNSAFSVIDQYNRDDRFLRNGYIKGDTESMTLKGATLNQMRSETFTKIIIGAAPIDEFDSYVEKWRKLGGDDITKEINAAK